MAGSCGAPRQACTGANIDFVNRNVGYVVGGPDWAAIGPGSIFKTTDGGQSWQAQTLNTLGWMAGLTCKDTGECWISGRSGVIQRTTDNGQTWQDAANNSGVGGWLVGSLDTQQQYCADRNELQPHRALGRWLDIHPGTSAGLC